MGIAEAREDWVTGPCLSRVEDSSRVQLLPSLRWAHSAGTGLMHAKLWAALELPRWDSRFRSFHAAAFSRGTSQGGRPHPGCWPGPAPVQRAALAGLFLEVTAVWGNSPGGPRGEFATGGGGGWSTAAATGQRPVNPFWAADSRRVKRFISYTWHHEVRGYIN